MRFANPVDLLSLPLEHAARALANDPAIAQTDWGKGLQAALQTTGQVRAFKQGLAEGIWEGGKSLVVGVVSMAAKTLRYGADNTALGSAGDALRGLTGKMPDWLEATIPSEKRGDATSAAIVNMGSGIKNYLANRTPGQVASDLSGAIGKAWEGLKADHAAAAAQGPEAEARWWGKTIGRIGFEVGATFIPIAGQAGKVSTVAKGADAAADTLRGADRLADMGRGAEAVGAVDKGADGLRAAETLLARGKRILGDLPLNSKTLDDLFQAGKLTMDEARALAKNAGWKDSSGRWIYPPNEGFEGIPNLIRLGNKDQLLIDRYGGPTGKFASPLGESYTARALPQGSNRLEFHVYKIVGDIEVLAGKATPWFDEAGGAIQYKFPRSMSDLIYNEKLVELRR